MSTRIESHIPGTQAHRERDFIEHENEASLRGTHHHSAVPPTTGHTGNNMNTAAPTYANDVTGGRTGMAPTTGVPATGGVGHHGTTMGERVSELQGNRRHPGATGALPGAGANTSSTSATGTKPHMGDKVMGGVEAAVGRMTNNPAMEQSGWERKTFGDPKHRTDGLAHGGGGAPPVTQQQNFGQQQGYGPTGQPAQQGFTNPGAGHAAPAYPPPGGAAGY